MEQQQVRVEIVPRTAVADDEVRAYRAETVGRLANLGQVDDPGAGEVGGQVTAGYTVRVGGVEFAADAYAIEPAEADGRALVSLVLAADGVQIGANPATSGAAAGVRSAGEWAARPGRLVHAEQKGNQPGMWGQPGPDPRANIPGWQPEATDA